MILFCLLIVVVLGILRFFHLTLLWLCLMLIMLLLILINSPFLLGIVLIIVLYSGLVLLVHRIGYQKWLYRLVLVVLVVLVVLEALILPQLLTLLVLDLIKFGGVLLES